MDILDSVLLYSVPVEWEDTSRVYYESERYRLYEVSVGGREYATEVNPFLNGDVKFDVKRMQRVQNPYQLGRFELRKEQKKFRGEHLEVVKYYHPLRKADLEIALEHNMDVRRYCNKHSGQYNSVNPKFYKTPGGAFNSISPCEIILICNVLGSSYEGSSTWKSTDTEYMPTYVVTVG